MYDEDLNYHVGLEIVFYCHSIHREEVGYKDVDIVVYNMEGLSSTIGGNLFTKKKSVLPANCFHPATLIRWKDYITWSNRFIQILFIQEGIYFFIQGIL